MDDDSNEDSKGHLTRRQFLGASTATLAGLALPQSVASADEKPDQAGAFGELVATDPGGIDLYLERKDLLIGGRRGRAIAINGSIPGPVIRMQEGEEALIRVHNRMKESTSIHWHGILLPFDMDGVPGISFPGIAPGETFTYRYKLRQNGSYWYHSHTGLQEQLGHYGQLIVDPADEDPVDYDVEHSIVLSDWTYENPDRVFRKLKMMEGYFNFQRPTLSNIDDQMEATGKSFGEVIGKRARWDWMRMDPTDIADITGATYKYLINGRTAAENPTFEAKPGQKVRLRFTNASTMTFYDIRIPGLPMTVVEADGQKVEPVETDELRIGVAETYDVVIEMPDDRPYTLFAETMDRSGYARGTIAPEKGMSAKIPEQRRRPMLTMADMGMMMAADMDGEMKKGAPAGSHDADKTAADTNPQKRRELPTENLPASVKHGPDTHGPGSITMAKNAYRQLDDPGTGLGDDGRRVLTYGQLRALEPPEDRRPPTREIDLHLTGNMHKYIWGFNGVKWSNSNMIRFKYGERLRINFINDTMMSHPIHLHGMWMDLYAGHEYAKNPRKHTVRVQPSELLSVDINADAPGQWAFHCHLLYHMEAGMFRTVAVVRDLEGGPIDAKG
ncbi:MAG: copper resistance system multicopper oxidase [Myxococcota bacterium]